MAALRLRTSSPSTGLLGKLVAAALAASAVAACYSIDDSFPFACASDGSCPSDYVCRHATCYPLVGVGSGSCPTGYVQSYKPYVTAAGDSLHNTCTLACGASANGRACPTGFICTDGLDGNGHVCIDCTTSDDCAVGECCATSAGYNEAPATNFGCQDPSRVANVNSLICLNGNPPIACVARLAPGSTSKPLDVSCTPNNANNTNSLACDISKQNCANTNSKCTLVGSDSVSTKNTCVTVTGTKSLDEPCTRSSYGNDDCQKGLFCTPRPNGGASSMTCRGICATNADCAAIPGTVCSEIPTTSATAKGGTCEIKCSAFTTLGCPGTSRCTIALIPDTSAPVLACASLAVSDGKEQTVGVGGACTKDYDCRLGAGCVTPGVCATYCDSSHPCQSGTCKFPSGYPSGLGVCQ